MSDIFTIHDFENEQQWLKGRMNGIGGSDASVTIGRRPLRQRPTFRAKAGWITA